MKRKVTFGKIIWFIIIAYLAIGLVYFLAGSPLIAIPFDMVGWPWSMWGDYTNGFLDIQFFATAAAILIALILFLRMIFRKR